MLRIKRSDKMQKSLAQGGDLVENHNMRHSSYLWSPKSRIELILFRTFLSINLMRRAVSELI